MSKKHKNHNKRNKDIANKMENSKKESIQDFYKYPSYCLYKEFQTGYRLTLIISITDLIIYLIYLNYSHLTNCSLILHKYLENTAFGLWSTFVVGFPFLAFPIFYHGYKGSEYWKDKEKEIKS